MRNVLVALVTLAAAFLTLASPARADTAICEKWGSTSIQGGKYVVQNNNWGDDTTQCINVTTTGFAVTQASHNKPQNGAPGSYPSIYAGCHYAVCSTGSNLPMQASSGQFGGVRTAVSMTYPGSGVYDAAYDLWFDPTSRTDGQNTGAELMVWLNHTGSVQPVGSRVGTVNLVGGTWDVWFGNIGWNVVSYVRTAATTSIDFAVDTFYGDAVQRGYAQRAWYLTSVQAGFEPWVGGAGLAVDSFSYTVGGSPGGGGGCSAAYSQVGNWSGGFQGQVAVTNTGSTPASSWTVTLAFGNGQRITQLWGGRSGSTGSPYTVTNETYNGNLGPNASTTFGFLGTWNGSNSAPSVTCSR